MPPLVRGVRRTLNVSSGNNPDLLWLMERITAKE